MYKEIWKRIPGYKDYEASNLGRIKSLKFNRKKILKPGISSNGYRTVGLCRNGYMHTKIIATLILLAFAGPCPKGMETSHLNGNCLDNRLENLKRETHKQNESRKKEHGTDSKGEGNGNVKLTEKNVIKIKNLLRQRYYGKYIADIFNVTPGCISHIKTRYTWSHI